MKASIGSTGMKDLTTETDGARLTSPASRPHPTAGDNKEIVIELKGTLLTIVACSRTLRTLVWSGLLRRAELALSSLWFPIETCQSKYPSERC